MDTAFLESRSSAHCVRELYDLNNALVDAIADMLPTLRDEARRRAIVAAQEGLQAAEKKLADLVGRGG